METQALRDLIKNIYAKKPECRGDINFFLAHTWKHDLKDSGLDYNVMTGKDLLNEMVNGRLTNISEVLKIWNEVRTGVEIIHDISENIGKKKNNGTVNNVNYREYDMTDTHGNKIYSKGGTIYLKLAHEIRKLGVIDPKERVFAIKRERGKHLMKANNSYGFNEHFLNTPTLAFDKILLEDDYGKYLIPTKYVIENSQNYKHFLKRGFEKQIFLRIELIETFKQDVAISVEGSEEGIVG